MADKVYCRNCRFCKADPEADRRYTSERLWCSEDSASKRVDNAYNVTVEMGDIDKLNAKNNCKLFRKVY